jgi:Tol biopolymer transport system component/polyisoprenoid-binding protein YceI
MAGTVASPTLPSAAVTESEVTETVTSISSQPAATEEPARSFRLLSEQSQASYEVQEKFFDRPLPNKAVGVTRAVEGELQFSQGEQIEEIETRVRVNLSTIRSDAQQRDGAMNEWLATDRYPMAEFASTQVTGLPASYTEGQEVFFQLNGDLAIRGVTRPTTFDVLARLQGNILSGRATAVISMDAFGIPVERFFGLSIEDSVMIALEFTAVDAAGGETAAVPEPLAAVTTTATGRASPVSPLSSKISGHQDLIAYISQRDGNDEIYLMTADGSIQARLTDSPAIEGYPRWSQDGARLTYTSSETLFEGPLAFHGILIQDLSWIEMTGKARFDGIPALSPDSSQVSYSSNGDIYVMSIPGKPGAAISEPARLTDGPVYEGSPAWSPDGRKIVYSVGNDRPDIFVMNANGSNQTNLTRTPDFEGIPVWSPDGRFIAFEAGEFNTDIYVINVKSSEKTRLTATPGFDGFPVWSPDGTQLAFRTFRDGNSEIYVMIADGSGLANLTDNPASDESPTWSPDGSRLAFASDRDGNYQIFSMAADGSSVTRLTDDPVGAGGPVWKP